MKKIINHIGIFLRGMFMGACDTVPGISGGTIAFITGIYEKLIESLNAIDAQFFKMLGKLKIKESRKKVNGTFLTLLVLGILSSILFLANLIHYLLENHRILIWSFFFGLILASAYILLKQIKQRKKGVFVMLGAGFLIAFLITSVTLRNTPDNLFYIFFAGVISIVAMVLPGISGSYILLIIGKYDYIIGIVSEISSQIKAIPTAISQGNPVTETILKVDTQLITLGIFATGAILGVLFFSKLIHWLFKKYYYNILALLTGFMLGSLNKVWPWKINPESADAQNTLPSFDLSIFEPLLLIFLGIILVLFFDFLKNRFSTD